MIYHKQLPAIRGVAIMIHQGKLSKRRLVMKKLLISFVLIIFAAPTIGLADGKADFNANCTTCHGGNARTNARRAKMLNIDPSKLYLSASEMEKAAMIEVIEKGKGKMPAFENKLTKSQITAIVDYIKGLSKK
jgi:mono/diheme cytochrome c family protein